MRESKGEPANLKLRDARSITCSACPRLTFSVHPCACKVHVAEARKASKAVCQRLH